MGIFEGIDFDNLPSGFKEDSVREEIIAPLLKILGYSAFNEDFCILRSPRLAHPFTQYGTARYRLELIPDYVVRVKGKNAFIVEAKAPNENILLGRNVEQAYSYAINREIQAKRFVLCNGREISIFDVMEKDPLLSFRMGSAGVQEWESVYTLLSPMAFLKPEIFNYIPDFGVWCFRNGLEKVEQKFYNCYFSDVSRLSDSDFTITATIQRETDLLGSFDFSAVCLEEFMNQAPKHLREQVWNALNKYPFRYQTKSKEDSFPLTFTAFLSGEIQRNREEVYMPLRVARFM